MNDGQFVKKKEEGIYRRERRYGKIRICACCKQDVKDRKCFNAIYCLNCKDYIKKIKDVHNHRVYRYKIELEELRAFKEIGDVGRIKQRLTLARRRIKLLKNTRQRENYYKKRLEVG